MCTQQPCTLCTDVYTTTLYFVYRWVHNNLVLCVQMCTQQSCIFCTCVHNNVVLCVQMCTQQPCTLCTDMYTTNTVHYVTYVQTFATLPDTVTELDDAIHTLQARVDCTADVDISVSYVTLHRVYWLCYITYGLLIRLHYKQELIVRLMLISV